MTTDPFDQAPASTAGGAFVRLHQLAEGADLVTREYASNDPDRHQTVKTRGRLVLMTPVKMDKVPRMNPRPGQSPTQDRWTVNVVILNGETITNSIDGNTGTETELPEPVVPNSKTALVEGMFVTATMLGDQLQKKVNAGGGMLLGRIGTLKARPKQNPPYVLCEFTPEEADVARAYLAKFHNPFAG
jgi:hypothetical protein